MPSIGLSKPAPPFPARHDTIQPRANGVLHLQHAIGTGCPPRAARFLFTNRPSRVNVSPFMNRARASALSRLERLLPEGDWLRDAATLDRYSVDQWHASSRPEAVCL